MVVLGRGKVLPSPFEVKSNACPFVDFENAGPTTVIGVVDFRFFRIKFVCFVF